MSLPEHQFNSDAQGVTYDFGTSKRRNAREG